MDTSNLVPIIAALITAGAAIIAAVIQAREKARPFKPAKRAAAPQRAPTSSKIQTTGGSRLAASAQLISLLSGLVFLANIGYEKFKGKSPDIPSSRSKIKIVGWPAPGTPGTGSRGAIEGTVAGSVPPGAWVLVYACVNAGDCYIQPFDTDYKIFPLNGKWSTTTHLGDRYVALLVTPGFANPPAEAPNPPGGEGVLASDEKQSTDQQ